MYVYKGRHGGSHVDTNHSRGVWSGREGPEEAVGGALKGTELGAAFEGSEDEI